jgi:hypothetical protein
MPHTFLYTACSLIFGFPGYHNSVDGRFITAKALVPQCLDSCSTITIHKFFWKMWRYIDTYRYVLHVHIQYICAQLDKTIIRKGLNMHQAAYTNRKYASHRRVGLPSNIPASLAIEDTLKSS